MSASGFTRKQQPEFQALKRAAWERVCAGEVGRLKDKEALRAWYEEELEAATGKRSSRECDARRDYEAAMAHFERLAENGSWEWQLKAGTGDERRILHVLRERWPEVEVSVAYMLGIAEQALGFRPAALGSLSQGALLKVVQALAMQLQRQARDGRATDGVRRREAGWAEAGQRDWAGEPGRAALVEDDGDPF